MPSLRDDIFSKTNSQEQMLYLKTLFEEAKTNLGKNGGADELIPALVEYLQAKYKPDNLDTATLVDIHTSLYEWRPKDSFGQDAYIFTSVQGALLCITVEAMQNEPLNEPLKDMVLKCSQYIADIQQELEKDPHNKLTQTRLDIVSKAHAVLQDEELSNTEKATSFCQIISDNEAVFTQKQQHPRAMLFLKAVAVFTAFCIGAGIGGVFAYQKLFHQKNEEKTNQGPFNFSLFQPSSDNSLELEKDIDKKNKDTPNGPSAN